MFRVANPFYQLATLTLAIIPMIGFAAYLSGVTW